MDFFEFKDAFLVGVFMALMIGPVFFMVLQTSILKGIKSAIAFDIGVLFSDVCFMFIAYFGSKSLLEKIKDDPRLFLVGGLILIIYGLITYLEKRNTQEIDSHKVEIPKANNYLKLFIHGFLLNVINVGVLAFWLGLLVVVGPTLDMDGTRIFWYLTVVILGYFSTDIIKIILAKQLKSKLTPLVIYRVKKAMGIILILFGSIMMLKSFIPKKQIDLILKEGMETIKSP